MTLSSRRLFVVCVGLILAPAAGCNRLLAIPDLACNTAADCLADQSCAWRPGACTCKSGACYFDASVAVDWGETGCRACHGSLANPAPPLSIAGGDRADEIAVGAHQTHLGGGLASRPVACSECHQVPVRVDAPGHVDTELPAEVAFGALATGAGAVIADWERGLERCSSYCHGATLPGGTNTTPQWTRVDGSEAACGSCHGLPPAGGHPQSNACEQCHFPSAGPSGSIANRYTHVDGKLDLVLTCTSCHGTPGVNPAPPLDTTGGSATILVTVGAHQGHATTGALRVAIACTECHPDNGTDTAHADGVVDVIFGALADQGTTTTWDGGAATCATDYCHGGSAALQGGSETTPVWTRVDGSQKTCVSCHGSPPPPPHAQSDVCDACHAGYSKTGVTTGVVNLLSHIDGTIDVTSVTCTGCHGDPATGSSYPPRGTHGELQSSDAAVGSHVAHMEPSAWHRQVACGDCHLVPTSPGHTNGVVEVPLGGLAVAAGSTPAFDDAALSCTNVYCHGATLFPANAAGVIRRTPVWTQVDGTFNACGSSCHTNPPGVPHPQVGQCSTCHAAVIDANAVIITPSLHIDGHIDVAPPSCDTCHGSTANPAPPASTTGLTSTTALTVGAHQQHLAVGPLALAMPCDECHLVPAAVTDPAHLDLPPAEVVFGPLATTGAAPAAWDGSRAQCANVYCHGATLTGGSNRTPAWTTVDGSQSACGTCHGNPPPPPHPAPTGCNACHSATVTAAGTLDVAGGHHVDGRVDVDGLSCTSCHGDGLTNDPAPPLGTRGETLTTSPAVGAHVQHRAASNTHRVVQCGDCHVVPSSPMHWNGVVELAFGGPASAGGAAPYYDAASSSCADVYCHGVTLSGPSAGGAVKRTPIWTQVDGSFAACGASCHTNPPGAPHPASTQCWSCHAAVITASGSFANAALHVNGSVDETDPACNSCHGSVANDAPPVSTRGAVTTADIGVGAHQKHLVDGPMRGALACDECHVVPTVVGDPAHIDGLPSEVAFGGLAKTAGAQPAWTRATASCAGAYCHGATLAGGTLKTPVWTTVNGTQAACGTCHGNPPPPPHVQNDACGRCHPGYTKTGPTTGTVNLATHIDGSVDSPALDCSSCHGSAGGNAAPPTDTTGAGATTRIAVGAHQGHVTTGVLRNAIACTECHPDNGLDMRHADGSVDLAFGAVANLGTSTAWSGAAATCAADYCHGGSAALTGGTKTTPVWTTVDGSQKTCVSCHGNPPPPPHVQSGACSTCHAGYSKTGATTGTVDLTTHIDGTIDAATMTCTSCHGTTAVNAAPPVDTTGGSLTALVTVGAHQGHVTTGSLRAAITCSECHPDHGNNMAHSNGVIDMTFGALANHGTTTVWAAGLATCAADYCHGGSAALQGGTKTTPVWTTVDGTQKTCVSCHGNPPAAPHVQNNACGTCHVGYSKTGATIGTVNLATHIDGNIDSVALSCTSCHGAAAVNAAPPVDTTGGVATTRVTVGAHQGHVTTGSLRTAIACTECHPNNGANMVHSNSVVDMVFGVLANHGTTTVWAAGPATCAADYCHGGSAALSGGTKTTPVWTTVDGSQKTCVSCHGNPPPPPHLQNNACGTCHVGFSKTGATTGTVNLATHIDGNIDSVALSCTSCHGTAGLNAAPPVDTTGGSATTLVTVGAHQGHVTTGLLRPAIACTECHIDNGTNAAHSNSAVDMVFGALANQGTTTVWSAAAATCAADYCHGGSAALQGGTKTTPVWTTVDGTQKTCVSCHGNPPPAPHVQTGACGSCHVGYSKTGATTGTVNLTTHIDGKIDAATMTCTSCHGTTAVNAAPPVDTTGGSATTLVTVGAHQGHVTTGSLRTAIACTQCHPDHGTNMAHSNSVIDMTFGALANRGTTTVWAAGPATCAADYCHGGSSALKGGTKTTPVWTTVDGTQKTCVSCHGNPPPAPHVQNNACGPCHTGYTKTGATTGTVNLATHIDGNIDSVALSCTSCHGAFGVNAAPPIDTTGGSATTRVTVGAHQGHVTTGSLRTAIACTECHPDPGTNMQHANGVEDLSFGPIANKGTTTVWNLGARTCAADYCHGGSTALKGGTKTTPVWTTVDGTQKTCTACHGNPPPPAHVQNNACGSCHAGYTKTGATTGTVNLATHVNGTIDVVALTCSTCHGTVAVNNAPPADTTGGSATTLVTVGAHQGHVKNGTLRAAIACSECHPDPGTNMQHGNGVDDVTFGALANRGTVTVWNAAAATCAGNYCHGGSTALKGGTRTTPVWTTVDGTQKTCVSCHGNPPPAPHVQNNACGSCHSGYTKTGATTGTVNLTAHINGAVNTVALSCSTCHGRAGINNAPPADTTGASATTLLTVGAHQAHVTAGALDGAIACTECHPDPGTNMAHANGVQDVVFGALANRGTVTVWNGAGGTCASGYCHGKFQNGNATNTPVWTGGAAQAACGTCHGTGTNPTPGGTHPAVAPTTSCGDCHPGYTRTTVDTILHCNGAIDGAGEPPTSGTSCGACHASTVDVMTGVVAVTTKHTLAGADNPMDPGGAWTGSGTLKASPRYATASCVSMCHPDHPHDLTSPATATHEYNVHLDANARSTSRTSSTRDSTDFDAALATGGLCMSCHTLAVDANHPALSIATYNTSAHDYVTNAQGNWTYTLHDGRVFGRNCTKCHTDPADARPNDGSTPFAAVHSSSAPSLLAGTTNPNGAPASFICYNCHGNGTTGADYSGKNLAAMFAKTGSKHPANTDNVHNSTTEQNNAAFGNTLGVSGRHANCLDCHDQHEAMPTIPMGSTITGTASLATSAVACPSATGLGNKCYTVTGTGTAWSATSPNMTGWRFRLYTQAIWYPVVQVTSATQLLVYSAATPTAGNSTYVLQQLYRGTNRAGPALQGAWGAALTTPPAAWAAPTAASFTKKTIVYGTDLEATLCFKCHSAYYGPLPVSPSGGFTETDTAREFNPANGGAARGSFHPVLASAGGNRGVTKSILPPWTTTSLMACSDCHESETVTDLGGPHGSAAKFVLKGPNTNWGTSITVSSSGMPAGTFCANCHPQDFAGSRFPDHTRSDHRRACTICHVLIPHGSGRPGLLASLPPSGSYPPDGAKITDSAPYASGVTLGIVTYPTSSTTNWRKDDCGCNSFTNH
ncbi:MAG: CxxxxCH/CxxCH domain-containing protein [Deltaproteobacteria bacterium]|nr:CxxxxCH/CxxCH domain-containing protein [Deltaproteobacteria bacterium]